MSEAVADSLGLECYPLVPSAAAQTTPFDQVSSLTELLYEQLFFERILPPAINLGRASHTTLVASAVVCFEVGNQFADLKTMRSNRFSLGCPNRSSASASLDPGQRILS